MRLRFKIPVWITQGFLFLMLIAGSYDMSKTYDEYGWEHEVTTIIGEQSSTRIVSLNQNIMLLAFLLWFIICIFILKTHIYSLEKKLEQALNPEVS